MGSSYDAYRAAARRTLAPVPQADIPVWGAVQVLKDGAFVEAVVWVPNSEAAEPAPEKPQEPKGG